MLSKLSDLNGIHNVEDVYIIGSGPSLNDLTENNIEFLKRNVTIGLNRVQYKVPLSYFVSSYAQEILAAELKAEGRTTLLHLRPSSLKPITPKAFGKSRLWA